MLLLLNREIKRAEAHARSQYVHPVELYKELLRLSGELSTFTSRRLAPEYGLYDHDALDLTFEPVLSDIQRLLSLDIGRAIRLNLIEKAPNAFVATVRTATSSATPLSSSRSAASKPLSQVQQQFPALCKIGTPR